MSWQLPDPDPWTAIPVAPHWSDVDQGDPMSRDNRDYSKRYRVPGDLGPVVPMTPKRDRLGCAMLLIAGLLVWLATTIVLIAVLG